MSLLDFTQPLLPLAQLKQGRLVSVAVGHESLVLQRRGREILGFPARCPHRGTALVHASQGQSPGVLTCPYHGWRISAAGQVCDARGVTQTRCAFEPYRIEAHAGYAWLIGNGPVDLTPPPGFQYCGSAGYTLSAPFHVVLDNFNEGSHTPFVHRVTGPTPSELDAIVFDWIEHPTHIDIHYQGPQRKHLLFHGLSALLPGMPVLSLTWDICWQTHFDPIRMVYHSKWFITGQPEAVQVETHHVYYIAPMGDERTRFHAFSFGRFTAYPTVLHPLLRLITARLTRNQILEDERFYARIRDIPRQYASQQLEPYDLPVVRIRTRAWRDYLKMANDNL